MNSEKRNISLVDAYERGDFDQAKDAELFAKKLIASISRGEKHVSVTLTDKSVIAFARELYRFILAENEENASGQKTEKDVLLTKKEAMDKLHVSSTTLWQWARDEYLIPVKVGSRINYRLEDINNLLNSK